MRVSLILIVASCLLAISGASHSPVMEEVWKYYQYKLKYQKDHLDLGAEQKKFAAFQENLNAINDFNSRSQSYKQGLNRYSDMTQDEFAGRMLITDANMIGDQKVTVGTSWLYLDHYEAPTYVDYSNGTLRVGPVRDQQLCASGWAMATTGLIEGLEFKNRSSQVIPLSVQNILDCDQYDSGCSGGSVESALRAIKEEHGLNPEDSYPYEGLGNQSCRYNKFNPYVSTMYLKTISNLASGDELMLQKTVAKYGPVAVGLDASPGSFQRYKSGIYFDDECKNDTINHHMLVVGYGHIDGQEYWRLKNSWSDDWGMSGYMLLARNKNNHCGIATRATIVEISN